MGDFGVYCGGAGGPAWLRHAEELTPYETDYAVADVVCGVEPVGTSWGWGRADLLTELRYSFLGGSEINLGSHRHAISAGLGFRARLTMLALDVGASGGYTHTALNFGKGVPLPSIDGATVQVHAGVGVDLCWRGAQCITPYVEFIHEWGFIGDQYLLPMVIGGMRLGVRSEDTK